MPEPHSPFTEAGTARQILDQKLDFQGSNGFPGFCRLRVFATVVGIVAILTERAENPGPSVTNAAEAAVRAAIDTMGCEPDTIMWVEHYGKESYGQAAISSAVEAMGCEPDTALKAVPRGRRSRISEPPRYARIRIQNGHAHWEHMPNQMMVDLLGSVLP